MTQPRAPHHEATASGPLVHRGGWLALAGRPLAADLASCVAPSAGLHVAADSAVFADLLERERPRIALLEVPPAAGSDVELALRERRRRTTLRIVHLTPAHAVHERVAALEAGFDEALPLSITADELARRLAVLARRAVARPNGGSILPVAVDAELDLVAHELRRGGRLVHLRPKEFRLLALLAGHPGRAYTRRQLLDRVWGPEHGGDPRTIDVHVRWIRSKIEPDPERPAHLVTVRGLGYRLDPPSG